MDNSIPRETGSCGRNSLSSVFATTIVNMGLSSFSHRWGEECSEGNVLVQSTLDLNVRRGMLLEVPDEPLGKFGMQPKHLHFALVRSPLKLRKGRLVGKGAAQHGPFLNVHPGRVGSRATPPQSRARLEQKTGKAIKQRLRVALENNVGRFAQTPRSGSLPLGPCHVALDAFYGALSQVSLRRILPAGGSIPRWCIGN